MIRSCIRCGKEVVTTQEFDRQYPAAVDCGCGSTELARLREQADALAAAHQRVRSIILSVENRCMAADGPVTPTLEEMTEDELRGIWQASDAALRTYREATQ